MQAERESMPQAEPTVPGPHLPGAGDGGSSDGEDEGSDAFRMFQYKVKQCTKARAHDWCSCCYSHPGEKAKRRDPLTYSYAGAACPEFRRNGACKRGDACPLAHGVFETWLHPQRYRTQMCSDGANCKRRICFFAHNESELRKLEDDPVWLQQQQQTERSAEQLGIALPRTPQRGSLDTLLSTQQQQQQQQRSGSLGIKGVSGPSMAPFNAQFGPSSAPAGPPSLPTFHSRPPPPPPQQQQVAADAAFVERIRDVITEFASQGKGLSQAQMLQVLQALTEQQEDSSRMFNAPPAPAFPVLGMGPELHTAAAAPSLLNPHMQPPPFAEPAASLGAPQASLAGVPLMHHQGSHQEAPFMHHQRAHSSGQLEGLPAFAHLTALQQQQQQQQQQQLALPLELQSSQLAQQLQALHTAQQSQWQAPAMQGGPPSYHLGGPTGSNSALLHTLMHPNLHALQLAQQQQQQQQQQEHEHHSAPAHLPFVGFDPPRSLPQQRGMPLRTVSFSVGDPRVQGEGSPVQLPAGNVPASIAQHMLLMQEAQQQQQPQPQVVPFAGSMPLLSEQQLQLQQAQQGAQDELRGAHSAHSAHSGRRSQSGRRHGVLLEEEDVMAHVRSAPPTSSAATLPCEPPVAVGEGMDRSIDATGVYSTSEPGAAGLAAKPTGSEASSAATTSSSSPPLSASPSRVVRGTQSAHVRGPALSSDHATVGSPGSASRVQGSIPHTAALPHAHTTHPATLLSHAPASAPNAFFPHPHSASGMGGVPPHLSPSVSSLPLPQQQQQHHVLGAGGTLHAHSGMPQSAHAMPQPHHHHHALPHAAAELWRLAEQQPGSEFARVQLMERGHAPLVPELGKTSWASVPEQDEGPARDSASSLELAALSLNTGNTLEGSSSIAQLSGLSRLMSSSTWAGSDASQRDSPATSFSRGLSFAGASDSGLRSSNYAGTLPMSPARQGFLGSEAQMAGAGLPGLGSFESTKHSPLQQRLMQSQLSNRTIFGTGSRSMGSGYPAMPGSGHPLLMRREGASDDGAFLGVAHRPRAPDYGLSEEDGQKAQQTVSALLAQVTRRQQNPQGPADA